MGDPPLPPPPRDPPVSDDPPVLDAPAVFDAPPERDDPPAPDAPPVLDAPPATEPRVPESFGPELEPAPVPHAGAQAATTAKPMFTRCAGACKCAMPTSS